MLRERRRDLLDLLALLVPLVGASLLALAPPSPADDRPTLVIAHRGASHDAPEHTFFAYDLAVEHDADFLECDLQLTRDEVLVCVHDTTVDRTSDGTGPVGDHTLEQLRAMDWGSWFNEGRPDRARPEYAGAAIVPLEEQLDCYLGINPRMRFHLETKAPSEHGGRMEPLLVELLHRKGLVPAGPPDPRTSTVVVQSFERASLDAVKALAPSLPTAWLWAVPPPEVLAGSLPDTVDVAAPMYLALLADPTFVTRAHAAGHDVHTWTVNDPDTMDQLIDMGVDGIFTDRPDVLRARVDARGAGVPASLRANPSTVQRGCAGVAGTVRADSSGRTAPVGPGAGEVQAGDGAADAGTSGVPPAPAARPTAEAAPTLPATGPGTVPASVLLLGAALVGATAVTLLRSLR